MDDSSLTRTELTTLIEKHKIALLNIKCRWTRPDETTIVTYTCGNLINNNDERTQFFRKIYFSHFIRKGCEKVAKGLCVSGELETGQTATYWPLVPLTVAALLFHSAGLLNRRSWGPKPYDIVYMDFVSMPVSKGKRYILTILDNFSRHLTAIPGARDCNWRRSRTLQLLPVPAGNTTNRIFWPQNPLHWGSV